MSEETKPKANPLNVYRVNDIVIAKSKRELSQDEIERIVDEKESAGIFDPKNRERESISREQLLGNEGLKGAYKAYKQKREGKAFDGSDEDLIDDYMEQMRFYDTNLGSLGMLAGQLSGNYYNEVEKTHLATMFDTWDKVAPWYSQESGKWKALVDFGEAVVTDPATIAAAIATATIGGAPIAAAGQLAARQATQQAIRQALKGVTLQAAKKGMVGGAVEGGLTSGVHNASLQNVKSDLGLQDGVNWGQAAASAGIGAATGGLLGAGLGAAEGKIGAGVIEKDLVNNLNAFQGPNRPTLQPPAGSPGNPVPKLDPNDAQSVLNAGTLFKWEYSNVGVVGEPARKQAREDFLNRLSTNARAYHQAYTNGTGIPYSAVRQKIDGMMQQAGITDKDDFATIITKVSSHRVAGKDIDTYSAFVNGLESEAFERVRQANLIGGDVVKEAENFIKASGLAGGVSTAAARATANQAHRFRDQFDFLTMASLINGIVNSTTPQQARGALNVISNRMARGMNFTAGAVNEVFRYNVLSGVETLTTNLISSAAVTLEKPFQRMLAGTMNLDKKTFTEGASQLIGLTNDFMGTLKYTAQAFIHSKNQISPGNFTDTQLGREVYIGDKDLPLKEIFNVKKHGWMNAFGNSMRVMGKRGMIATDEFVKQIAFKSRVFSLAFTEAMNTPGISVKQAKAKANMEVQAALQDQLDSVIKGTPPTHPLVTRAMRDAREATFTEDFTNRTDGFDLRSTIGQLGTQARDYNAATSIVLGTFMPFIRTPMNVFNHAFERTPGIQLLSKRFRDDMAAGGQRAQEAEAAIYMGALYWSGAILATNFYFVNGRGPVTSTGKHDKARAAEQQALGTLQNSIVIDPETGEQIQFTRAEPYSRYLAVLGAMQDVLRYGTDAERDEVGLAMVLTAAQSFLDMPALQGVKDLVTMTDNTETLSNAVGNKLGAFVPFFRVMRNFDNEHLKQAYSIADHMRKNLPGFNDKVDYKRDPVTGEKIKRPDLKFLTFQSQDMPMDPLSQELRRLVPSIQAPVPTIAGGRIDMREHKMSTGRSVYDHYQEYLTTYKIGGQTMREALQAIIDDPLYREQLSDPIFGAMVKESGGRVEALKAKISEYRSSALASFMQTEDLPKGFKEQLGKAKEADAQTKYQDMRKSFSDSLNKLRYGDQ